MTSKTLTPGRRHCQHIRLAEQVLLSRRLPKFHFKDYRHRKIQSNVPLGIRKILNPLEIGYWQYRLQAYLDCIMNLFLSECKRTLTLCCIKTPTVCTKGLHVCQICGQAGPHIFSICCKAIDDEPIKLWNLEVLLGKIH